MVNIEASRATLRMDIGFHIGMFYYALLRPV